MASLCASSSIFLSYSSSSSTSPKTHLAFARKSGITGSGSPFVVGFSLSISKPNRFVRAALPGTAANRKFMVRSEKEETETGTEKKGKRIKVKPVHIPVDQRWMFYESELTGPDIWNKTWYPKAADHVNTSKPWYVVDATDKILGRLASTIAIYIRGKNLATFSPSTDMGAFVIVVNAEKIAVSGKKRTQKLYRRHSGRPGGMTVETFDQLQKRIPERIIEHAVRGMLPKGRLGRALFNHLKVYKGPDHPHEAQKPVELPIKDKRIQMER